MPSNHLILCRPLLLLPSIFPSIRVFSDESALRIRWPKYWSFSFSISPSSEHPGLISRPCNFPGGPVLKTLPSNVGDVGLIPGQGATKNQNIKQKQYCNQFNKGFQKGPHKNKMLKNQGLSVWAKEAPGTCGWSSTLVSPGLESGPVDSGRQSCPESQRILLPPSGSLEGGAGRGRTDTVGTLPIVLPFNFSLSLLRRERRFYLIR